VPSVDRDWRPYSRGQWVYTEYGWTFVADEPWGWAPFHYGRWVYYPPYGWVWIPGDEWAPAWVAWRYGPDYLGWAPLGPFGISLDYYAYPSVWFCVPVRYFHQPSVYRYFVPTSRVLRILRTTYFPGVPRRGFYYSPPAPYVALASRRPVVQVSAKGITPSWVPRGATFRPALVLRTALRSAPVVVTARGWTVSPGTVRGVQLSPRPGAPVGRPWVSPQSSRPARFGPGVSPGHSPYRPGPFGSRSYSGTASTAGKSYRAPSWTSSSRSLGGHSASRGPGGSRSGYSASRSFGSSRSSGGSSRGHR
jgi:hypothetical protein